jgi:predicted Rossmann-fold nucleotide-binding protein
MRMMWLSGGGTGLMGMVEMAAVDLQQLILRLILLFSAVLCVGF